MNWLDIPAETLARVTARRGTAHPYANFEPARAALVVIDMQRGFMEEAVGHAVCPMAHDIVPNINALAAAMRAAGGTVVWIKNTFNERSAAEWSVQEELATPERRARRHASMSEGMPGHELWPALEVAPGDLVVKKYRYSAFLPGACDLPDILRARAVDTVIITGTVTNICCESSARDAMMTNFKTIMVSDGNAAMSMVEHHASLLAFYNTFGDVLDTEMILARLVISQAA